MLTIAPPPESRIAGAQCFMPKSGPVRLTASVRFHASTVVLTMPWRAIVPALLTRMCKPPNAANVPPRSASMSVSITAAPSRTKSSATAVPCPPAAPVISATLFASFGIEFSLEKKDNASPQRTQRTRKGREGTEYGSGTVVGWVERSETHHQQGYQSDSSFAAFNPSGAMALPTENPHSRRKPGSTYPATEPLKSGSRLSPGMRSFWNHIPQRRLNAPSHRNNNLRVLCEILCVLCGKEFFLFYNFGTYPLR